MKKFLGILVLGLLWCSTVFSVESLTEGQKGTIKFESIPVVTLNQFLKGETKGDSVQISGKLKFPKKKWTGRRPAVVILHGGGGGGTNEEDWAKGLRKIGITTFVHSRIKNLTNVYIFGLGVLAILSTYFVGGNTFIPNDPSLYQPQIISELNIGDLSQIKHTGPKRFFYESLTSGFAQVAYSIVVVFLLQYFLFLNMGHKASYKRFAPYMYIVIFAGLLWSAIFYSVGYSFYKIIAVFVIGVPLTPLVWQFMTIYGEKIARDRQLSQWEEVK